MAIDVNWMDSANCVGTDTEAFFPSSGPRDSATVFALRVCAGCDVRAECLRYAVNEGLDHGIYGGLLPEERSRMFRTVVA